MDNIKYGLLLLMVFIVILSSPVLSEGNTTLLFNTVHNVSSLDINGDLNVTDINAGGITIDGNLIAATYISTSNTGMVTDTERDFWLWRFSAAAKPLTGIWYDSSNGQLIWYGDGIPIFVVNGTTGISTIGKPANLYDLNVQTDTIMYGDLNVIGTIYGDINAGAASDFTNINSDINNARNRHNLSTKDLNADKVITLNASNIGGDLTIGRAEAGKDYELIFNGEDNIGVIQWNEDSDRFDLEDTMYNEKEAFFNNGFDVLNGNGRLKDDARMDFGLDRDYFIRYLSAQDRLEIWNTAFANGITITSDLNIGINNTQPKATLDVNGSALISGDLNATTTWFDGNFNMKDAAGIWKTCGINTGENSIVCYAT